MHVERQDLYQDWTFLNNKSVGQGQIQPSSSVMKTDLDETPVHSQRNSPYVLKPDAGIVDMKKVKQVEKHHQSQKPVGSYDTMKSSDAGGQRSNHLILLDEVDFLPINVLKKSSHTNFNEEIECESSNMMNPEKPLGQEVDSVAENVIVEESKPLNPEFVAHSLSTSKKNGMDRIVIMVDRHATGRACHIVAIFFHFSKNGKMDNFNELTEQYGYVSSSDKPKLTKHPTKLPSYSKVYPCQIMKPERGQDFNLKHLPQIGNSHGKIIKMRDRHATFFSGVDSLPKFGKDLSKVFSFSELSVSKCSDGNPKFEPLSHRKDILSNKSYDNPNGPVVDDPNGPVADDPNGLVEDDSKGFMIIKFSLKKANWQKIEKPLKVISFKRQECKIFPKIL